MARAERGAIPPDRPCVLVESGAHGLTVSAVNLLARQEGLRPGLRLADARAAFPDLTTRPAEPARDRTALVALATAAGRYGPSRNTEEEDGLWVDITGVAHLFGGEHGLATDLIARCARAGYTALVGIADTPGAAYVMARYQPRGARIAIAPAGQTKRALADLPVAGLRLDARALVLLRRLGLGRIGQLYGLPRIALARRFRDEKAKGHGTARGTARAREDLAHGVVLRLDQALGTAADPRAPLLTPPVRLVRSVHPEGLVTHEGLMSATEALAETFCRNLGARGEGARRVQLCLYRVDGTVADITAGTRLPCREPGHLMRLVAEKLGQIDAGFGIDMLTLGAVQVEALADTQTRLDGRAADSGQRATAHLIDRLANRLGAGRVFQLARFSSHIPERAQVRRIASASQTPRDDAQLPNLPIKAARPAFLLTSPEPIDVVAELPDGPPARFRWRRVSRRVLRAAGPERIAPEWWRGIGQDNMTAEMTGIEKSIRRIRDYYEVEDEHGGRYWVFRAGLYPGAAEDAETVDSQPAWFMHGLFG
ncbi:MAG: DNA polymerase Y family protein [Hyphomicrobiaceae bacterium]|nr:DNA polymerase Y family protein [Hyphomicrobiaceae bacterium]